jgi:hypothetical protein
VGHIRHRILGILGPPLPVPVRAGGIVDPPAAAPPPLLPRNPVGGALFTPTRLLPKKLP